MPTLPIVLRWNGVDGVVLAETAPDRRGTARDLYRAEGAPNHDALVATRRDARGVHTYGTPARASYQILGRERSFRGLALSRRSAGQVLVVGPDLRRTSHQLITIAAPMPRTSAAPATNAIGVSSLRSASRSLDSSKR